MKVCEKVKKKGTTSYNEVADELVGEFTNPAHVNSLTDQVGLLFETCYQRIHTILHIIIVFFNIIFIHSNMIRKISEGEFMML